MSYQVYFPSSRKTAQAVVVGLEVYFSHGVEPIRLRSRETAVRGITRHYPGAAVYEQGRFGFVPSARRIA